MQHGKLYLEKARIWLVVINVTLLYAFVSLPYLCLSSSGPHSTVSRCPPNEYQCGGTELCIHMSKLCNGIPDCTDSWDEGPHCRGSTVTHMHSNVGLVWMWKGVNNNSYTSASCFYCCYLSFNYCAVLTLWSNTEHFFFVSSRHNSISQMDTRPIVYVTSCIREHIK